MVNNGSAPWAGFSVVADAIAATAAKNRKVELLGAYLRELRGDDLATAARYFSGRVFAVGDGRVLNLGGAAVVALLGRLAPAAALGSIWHQTGDAGEVAARALATAVPATPALTVAQVQACFVEISATRKSETRIELLAQILHRCSAIEAKYVIKLVLGEMRIGLREGLVEEAIAVAFALPRADVNHASMLVADLGRVAELALGQQLHDISPQWFVPLRYMLATPVPEAAAAIERLGNSVWIEDKYDGIRCQLHLRRGRVALYSRDLNEVSAQFPEVTRAAAAIDRDILLDGELLAFSGTQTLGFAALQKRLGRKSPPARLLAEVPVIYVAWDVLMDGAEILFSQPLQQRRARLEELALGDGFRLAHHQMAEGGAEVEQFFLDARARGNEGLMLKDPNSPYTPGRRGLAWLKLKRPLDTLDVVVLGAQWGHGKRHAVLSDVTFGVRDPQNDELVPIGKAYSGLTDSEIAAMTQELLQMSTAVVGPYHEVRPEIVLEVAFDNVQKSRRHRSGYALRFPRIVRWRHDKAVADVNTLEDVARLAALSAIGPVQLVDEAKAD